MPNQEDRFNFENMFHQDSDDNVVLDEFVTPDSDEIANVIAPTFSSAIGKVDEPVNDAPKTAPQEATEEPEDNGDTTRFSWKDISFKGMFDSVTTRVNKWLGKGDPEDSVSLPAELTSLEAQEDDDTPKRHPLMRVLGAIVPRIGDQPFDVFRKCLMLAGVLVFIGAATYLVDDLILIPIHNDLLTQTLQGQYDPDMEPSLSKDEQKFEYPKGMDSSFKKLYYQNNDLRGWINYATTDGSTFTIDYPIVQSTDNDYYLFHDFNRTYNKNGTLFFDYRNDITSKESINRNTIVYGHNMASGQMFAALNKLLLNLDFARLAPTFTMNTIYGQAEYKVFAVMLLNNNAADGVPFGYLRTDFKDDADFSGFLTEIAARSLYNYSDVDVCPADEIVTLSTCTDTAIAHYNDARTVIVARKVRKGESADTDVSKIDYNTDVLMPYAWYINQKMEPHPYYTDPNYTLPPFDTLLADASMTTTKPSSAKTTTTKKKSTTKTTADEDDITTYPEEVTTTTEAIVIIPPEELSSTTAQTAAPRMTAIAVESTPAAYYVGSSFDFENTKVVGIYSDGFREAIDSSTCAITGFDSTMVGECVVSVHYGSLSVSYTVEIINIPGTEETTTTLTPDVDAPASTNIDATTTTTAVTTSSKTTTTAKTTEATKTTTTTATTVRTTTTVVATTAVPATTTAPTTTTTNAPTTTTTNIPMTTTTTEAVATTTEAVATTTEAVVTTTTEAADADDQPGETTTTRMYIPFQ